jgi:hypothetical protein
MAVNNFFLKLGSGSGAPAPSDLAVAGVVVLLALIAFVAVLTLYRDAGKGKGGARGTAFVKEGGKSVRRSTRERKSIAPVEIEPKVRGLGSICAWVRSGGRSLQGCEAKISARIRATTAAYSCRI